MKKWEEKKLRAKNNIFTFLKTWKKHKLDENWSKKIPGFFSLNKDFYFCKLILVFLSSGDGGSPATQLCPSIKLQW